VVIDEELRNTGPSVEVIFGEIKQRYHKIWGENITITIKEVKKIIQKDDEMISPVVISLVNQEK
jgi:hypothetical protein